MKAIIAKNALGFIGIDGRLPWHCEEDLAHFQKLTTGQCLLVGRNTFAGLPKLKRRQLQIDARGEEMVNRFNIDWCIGGKFTYEKYARFFTELHISTIEDDYTEGDTTFPELDLHPDCKIFNYSFYLHKK